MEPSVREPARSFNGQGHGSVSFSGQASDEPVPAYSGHILSLSPAKLGWAPDPQKVGNHVCVLFQATDFVVLC